MCEFCKPNEDGDIESLIFTTIIEEDKEKNIEPLDLFLEIDGNNLLLGMFKKDEISIEGDSKINFCPKCGRDLRKQTDKTLLPPIEIYEQLKGYCDKYGVKFENRALDFDFVLELLGEVERKCLKE